MNEQEMQFADPDWKPTGQLPGQAGQADLPASSPDASAAPVNNQNQAFSPYEVANLADYGQGYQGARQKPPISFAPIPPQPYAGQAPVPYGPVPVVRRRSRWWIWLILAILFFSMMSGGLFRGNSGYNSSVPSYPNPPMEQGMPPQQQFQSYDLQGATQISIDNPTGAITVQVSTDGNQMLQISGSPAKVSNDGQNATITSPTGGDLTVTVPQGITLNLHTGQNNIEVDGFTGQLNAQTDSGFISLNGDSLNQKSTITTSSGNIDIEDGSVSDTTIASTSGALTLNQATLSGNVTLQTGGQGTIDFNGSLSPQGHYQFTTDSGNITLTLPPDTSLPMKVSQKSGSFHSDFPPGTGNPSPSGIDITTGSGNIGIYKQ